MIYLTGSTGFIGNATISYFGNKNVVQFNSDSVLKIESDITSVIHLAGKAHDKKNTLNSNELYLVNTELTIKVFDAFLVSRAKVFITLSSVKAVADKVQGELFEEHIPNPITHYGKSKLLAEKYILSKEIPEGKRVFILRPCMIHGLGNKGNLNLLYKFVSKGIPWPLGSFENKRSYCNIDNLLFIFKELIEREDISSGVYNVADDDALSTNQVINLIAQLKNRRLKVYKISKILIKFIAKVGDIFYLPINSESLYKLTDSYLVCNRKIKLAIGKPLPHSIKDGLIKTIHSFND
jgi:nucleoside-diphosphate-sugar epimerase